MKKAVSHPLTIVSMLLGLVEVCLTTVYGLSSERMQCYVFWFVAIYTTGITGIFFYMLWHRNWVFYPPSEFRPPSIEEYVATMRGREQLPSQKTIEEVSEILSDERLMEKLAIPDVSIAREQGEITNVLQQLRNETIKSLQASVICMDSRPLKGEGGYSWEEPYDENLSGGDFLTGVWLRLQPFPPYPYGKGWLIRESGTDNVFDHIVDKDSRSIREIGITGGMVLEVIAA